MLPGRIIVLDVGKTLTKASLWGQHGRKLDQRQRYNRRIESAGRRWLDTDGIERWLQDTLTEFGRVGPVHAIVPVGHGAAAAIVQHGRLACPVPDYEDPIEPAVRTDYEAQRDPFASTGSPALPGGLNLGVQLHRLELERPGVLSGDARILTWPQYWAWKLCGVDASEVSSLGCHTDLWNYAEGGPSGLARARGWAARLAPLRRADEVLGCLATDWAARTGLPADTRVYCGLHDSNAALLAATGWGGLCGKEATLISTGTWIVAMHMPAQDADANFTALPQSRDCLVNVDVGGRPIPSARFMGGRELELMGGLDGVDPTTLARAVPEVLETGTMALPSWVAGVGPYPGSRGRWLREPRNRAVRAAAAWLYAALMTDTIADLIGGSTPLVVEGRFASSAVFLGALAALRPEAEVRAKVGQEGGVAFGALRLLDPSLGAPPISQRIAPLEANLLEYKARWRKAVEEQPCTT